jgi:hypothetical protein
MPPALEDELPDDENEKSDDENAADDAARYLRGRRGRCSGVFRINRAGDICGLAEVFRT